MPKKGSNIDPGDLAKEGSNTAATLVSSIERIISLEEEKAGVQEQIKDEYAAVKATGFDAKIVRKIVARLKRDPDEVQEEDALIETYERAIEQARSEREF